jgi:hypothetical protein
MQQFLLRITRETIEMGTKRERQRERDREEKIKEFRLQN